MRKTSEKTKQFAVIGNPVAHSLSPALHKKLYGITGYDGNYDLLLCEEHELSGVIERVKSGELSGINVTSPYKKAVMPFLDKLSDEALAIDAVNTVKVENGVVTGYNTDYYGFAKSLLLAGVGIRGKSFAVCGTGGAAKSVCYALKQYGAHKITTVSRDPEKGATYAQLAKCGHMDAIINCTVLGMSQYKEKSPVDEAVLKNFSCAVDLIYSPAETVFLKMAEKQGLTTLNGLGMLVLQGIYAFEIWTGIKIDESLYENIICEIACILAKRQ